ncbi:MAG: hypothetical protein JWQ04_2772 [Pedosphaera sp.]|nr:hypothetical protein [Pedosphaera sp.]
MATARPRFIVGKQLKTKPSPQEKSAAPKLIPARELTAWTGLSDKVLRSLAGKGFFPAAVKGGYQFIPTLVGLFRFYREQQRTGADEVYYDSMGNCAAQLGIPLDILKAASRQGCPAFKASRVYLLPLVKWFFTQPEAGQGKTNWADAKMEYSAKREKIKLTKDEAKAADWDDVAFGLNKGTSLLFSRLDRLFSQTLPPDLKGLSELAMKKRLVACLGPLAKEFRAELAKLGNLDQAEPGPIKEVQKPE